MPKVTKISLHCAEAEQVEGSNLRESLVRIPHGKSVREPDQGIPHLTLALALNHTQIIPSSRCSVFDFLQNVSHLDLYHTC